MLGAERVFVCPIFIELFVPFGGACNFMVCDGLSYIIQSNEEPLRAVAAFCWWVTGEVVDGLGEE